MREIDYLAAAGLSLLLITGCKGDNQDALKCPNTPAEVADQVGGDPRSWHRVLGEGSNRGVWENRDKEKIVFTDPSIGNLNIPQAPGEAVEQVYPGKRITLTQAFYGCTEYDERNPKPRQEPP